MNSKITHSTLTLFVLLIPAVALGQYTPLVGIPGISDLNAGFDQYINTLYMLSISIAALLAVIKIIIAGVKWMMSDIVTTKSEAKSDITNATIGLLIVMSAVLILTVINPQLTTTSVFVGTVDPKTAQVFTQSGKPYTLAPGDSEKEMLNTDANMNECTDPTGYGGQWYEDATADTAWCVRKANTSTIRSDQYNCPQDASSLNGYNCTEAIASCVNLEGTWEYGKSIVNSSPQYYRIICT